MPVVLAGPYPFGGTGPDDTTHYVDLTVPAQSETLTDFPVYVSLATLPAAFWSRVQADGGDIRVTESDGETRCPVDLVAIDTTGEAGELHFLASSLSSVTDTAFRIYYGASSALSQPAASDTYGRNAVWPDHELVWHGGDLTDSTGTHTLTATGVTPGDATGTVGSGTTFAGGTDRVETSDAASLGTGAISSMVWIQPDATEENTNTRVWEEGGSVHSFFISLNSSGGADVLEYRDWNAGDFMQHANASAGLAKGAWDQVAVRYNGGDGYTDAAIYRDGSSLSPTHTSNGSGSTSDDALVIGNRTAADRGFVGVIDELRIARVVWPAAYVTAAYANQDSPGTFYTVGGEQAA